jgi:iron complex transport system ATP-binding protein
MDPRHALQTMSILRGLAGSGLTVAVVLHDLSLALRFCDRAAVLDSAGRLAAVGPAADTLTPAILDPVFAVRFTALTADAGPAALLPALPPSEH